MNRTVSKMAGVAFAVLLAMVTTACNRGDVAAGASAESPSSRAAQAGSKAELVVKLGYQKIGAPFLLKSRRAALDEHLARDSARAEWREFKHGPALLEAINANEVDVGYVGETPPVFAQAGGVPFVYVATDPPAPRAEAIVVRRDSPIEKVTDLKGKKIALNRGSNVHFLLLKVLQSAKLSLEDVEVVYLAPGDARPAFETGKVDAWVIWDPFLAAAELSGSRVLVNGEGLVDNRFFYVARRDFASEHPDLVRDILAEYGALSDWESKNAEEASRILAEASGVAYDALLRAERRHAYGILPVVPDILQKQQVIADTFRKLELIPKDIKTADAFLTPVVFAKEP